MSWTGPIVGKVDSGVQVGDDANAPAKKKGSTPLAVAPVSSTFDADLARANLLRMRAEYKKAEDVCISILKTYPNSAATHTLLGDIYSDQGLLEQAAQWYELSLDLDPSSLSDQQKLADVREQMKERDHISSVEQLGLPESRPIPSYWWFIGAATILVLAGGLGYSLRHGRGVNELGPAAIQTPIRVSQADTVKMGPVDPQPLKAPTTPVVEDQDSPSVGAGIDLAPPPATSPAEDRAMAATIRDKSRFGDHLVGVVQDPRKKVATMTYAAAANEDERAIGADLAKTFLELSPEMQNVTIRAMRDDRLYYLADVPRTRYNDTLTDDWQKSASSPDAWIAYILTDEQYPGKPGNSSSGSSSSADSNATTTGSTPPPATGSTTGPKAGNDSTASTPNN